MSEEKRILLDKINEDLKAAMKSKSAPGGEERLSVLRMIKSKIIYVNARGDLSDAEIIKIIAKYKKELQETIAELTRLNKMAEVEQNKKELKIVEEYLPAEISADQIKEIVKQTIAETGAASMKDMGNVMKTIQAKYPGIDGKVVSQTVKESLNK